MLRPVNYTTVGDVETGEGENQTDVSSQIDPELLKIFPGSDVPQNQREDSQELERDLNNVINDLIVQDEEQSDEEDAPAMKKKRVKAPNGQGANKRSAQFFRLIVAFISWHVNLGPAEDQERLEGMATPTEPSVMRKKWVRNHAKMVYYVCFGLYLSSFTDLPFQSSISEEGRQFQSFIKRTGAIGYLYLAESVSGIHALSALVCSRAYGMDE